MTGMEFEMKYFTICLNGLVSRKKQIELEKNGLAVKVYLWPKTEMWKQAGYENVVLSKYHTGKVTYFTDEITAEKLALENSTKKARKAGKIQRSI